MKRELLQKSIYFFAIFMFILVFILYYKDDVANNNRQIISDWYTVTVVSKAKNKLSYFAFASDTEIFLKFSDGTSWKGSLAYSRSWERPLLDVEIGDTVQYRYNLHYFNKKQWIVKNKTVAN